ncbi:hypothetical protein [Natranaerofaba carboxydovora]|uniref:hypothetical protein n=1 Tax=Natranaerofaba carboxydovora TaxID=2742683 RepID=UPI001F14496B|nr:hypothetical protein [Natranaerofaba carboxydovora]UMZ75053.1 hypothetical protein ACONDI_02665 [Natranaerofaba carboxydovora]
MRRTHLKALKTAKESLYEEFLNSKGSNRMDLLVRIMEIDEDMEAVKKYQKEPILAKNGKGEEKKEFYN